MMGMLHTVIGVTCLLGCVHAYLPEIVEMFTNKISGRAIYYGKSQEGSCPFGSDLPPVATSGHIKYLVGINSKQYAGSISCGMCLRVRGTGEGEGISPVTGNFLVFVNNVCESCEEGGIDLAEDGDGHWNIEMEAVQCPVEDGKIEYKFQGSDTWYLRLQIRNTRIPVHQVHIVRNGGEEAMSHTSDGFWEFSNSQVAFPIHIKMTGVTDEVIEDIIPAIENGVVQEGEKGAQFSFDWDLPGV